jgi:23S rRNA (cytosine1962-C5)-methyltransferase
VLEIFQALPKVSERRLSLRLTPAGEKKMRQGGPWIYDTWVPEDPMGLPGDLAVVFDGKKRFVGIGLWDPTSSIRLRVLHAGSPVKIDAAWFHGKLAGAAALRATLMDDPAHKTDGYRLVNGENDGLPGVVVDAFADTCVIKLYSPCWIPHLPVLWEGLMAIHGWERVVLRLNRAMQSQPKHLHGLRDGQILSGPELSGPVLFRENGIVFEAEPVIGQKTGFFLDQRDNRARVEALSRGRDVLNVFSYTGGFSVYAARGGAKSVTSVDLSVPATEAARRNFAHNRFDPTVARCPHEALAQDAFVALEEMRKTGKRFGLVVLDPPMFAQSRAEVETALAAYARLTRLGLSVLAPGGVLVQASCSNRVDAESFFACIHEAARQAGRPLEEIERTGHALDHPVTFEQGSYLKCLFAKAA